MVVDYLGVVLTLGGCAMIMLPLIWVTHFNIFQKTYIE